jgi:hypothetical protein|nr:MAG TPA: hypothetical protein [Bacteriophage sp.]
MNHADNLTKEQVRNILLSFSGKGAYIRHKSRIIKPFLFAIIFMRWKKIQLDFI